MSRMGSKPKRRGMRSLTRSAVGEQLSQKRKLTEQRRQQKDSPVAILNAGGMNDGVQQQPLHIDEKMPLLALDQTHADRCGAPPVSFSCRLMRSRRGYRWMGARSPPGRLSP
jgi:hypothetical protein